MIHWKANENNSCLWKSLAYVVQTYGHLL